MTTYTLPRPLVHLVLVGLLAGGGSISAQDEISGRWQGSVELSDDETLQISLDIGRDVDGVWEGRLQTSSQSEPLEIEAITVAGRSLRFSVPAIPGSPFFHFTATPGGSQLTGGMTRSPPPPPPSTDVYLVEITQRGETWSLGEALNVSDRDGYDNQPSFLLDGSALLYTSQRDGQTDIWRHDLESGATRQVTETSESEYSPTPTPDGLRFSTVRVESDGTQRLWSFPLAGGEPELVLEEIAPVGYHAWLGADTLALFVLGSPHTLQIANPASGATRTITGDIGRSLNRIPNGSGVAFVKKVSDDDWRLGVHDPARGRTRYFGAPPTGSEDFVFASEHEILSGDGSKLLVMSMGRPAGGWQPVADLAGTVEGITRLALSPDGSHLAVVGNRPAGEAPGGYMTFPLQLERRVP